MSSIFDPFQGTIFQIVQGMDHVICLGPSWHMFEYVQVAARELQRIKLQGSSTYLYIWYIILFG